MAKPKRKLKNSSPRIAEPRLKGRESKNIGLRDPKRAFIVDGIHVYLRRKKANPALRARMDEKIKTGELSHVKTSDGVEIYSISDDSPLRRRFLQLDEMPVMMIESHIIQAACKRDWKLYYDGVAELGYRYKNGDLPADTGHTMFQNTMQYLNLRISRRGGPNENEIGNALRGVRRERTGRTVFLPPDSHIDRR